jgi:hypothetical protein
LTDCPRAAIRQLTEPPLQPDFFAPSDRRREYSISCVKNGGEKGVGARAARVAHAVAGGIGRARLRLRPPLEALLCRVSKTTFDPGIYSM